MHHKLNSKIVFRETTSGDFLAYTILSYIWGKKEIIYQDLKKSKNKSKTSWKKIQFYGDKVAIDGLEYF
jgi:hypothetical protein